MILEKKKRQREKYKKRGVGLSREVYTKKGRNRDSGG